MAHSRETVKADVAVLGSGPGGYTAAFRAADLGLNTVLIEQYPSLGGVCLNVGCIPSKALLHTAKVISEALDIEQAGIKFGYPEIDRVKLRGWVDGVVAQLTGGLASLAKRRKVQVISGYGQFTKPNVIEVVQEHAVTDVAFRHAIIAAGSRATNLSFLPEHPRIVRSTGALALAEIPNRMLVIGGGIIGLELATVYHELGTRVTIVELQDRLIPEADPDIVKPLRQRISKKYEKILLKTNVTSVESKGKTFDVEFEQDGKEFNAEFEFILVAVGRTPNGKTIGAKNADVSIDAGGFINTDSQQRTNIHHIFAIGDITGQPMLAHKATHQGKVAAEVIAGMRSGFDTNIIPSVAYTDPEIAWAGLTESEAKRTGRNYAKGIFPWAASGRALSMARPEGMTKILFDPDSNQVIGAGIVGTNAGELIAEMALAIEMGAVAQDIGLTIHPHPTLSETLCFAAEAYEGTITDLYIPRRK